MSDIPTVSPPEVRPTGARVAVCTIALERPRAAGRALAAAARGAAPPSECLVLGIEDENGGDAATATCRVVRLADLAIPDLAATCFRYAGDELHRAVAPYFLAHLFERRRLETLVLVDASVTLEAPPAGVVRRLETAAIVVTPHTLGLRDGATARDLLAQWTRIVADDAALAPRWLDLVPGLFDDVAVEPDPPCRPVPSAAGEGRFDRFDNGVPIPLVARRLHRELGVRARRFGNPFAIAPAGSFYRWLNEPVDACHDVVVTRLWHRLHGETPALQAAFPDVLGRDRRAYARWVASRGGRTLAIDVRLIPDLLDRHGRPASPALRLRRRLYRRLVEPVLPVLKPLIQRTVGRDRAVWRAIVRARMRLTGDPRLHASAPVAAASASEALAVNVAGYAQSEKGLGEAMRSMLRALDAAGIAYAVNNFVDHYSDNRESAELFHHDNPHPVNVVCVNADAVQHFAATNGVGYFQGRYNVGHWVWELSRFPEAWQPCFDYFDEIWVPTTFAQDAVARSAPVPVVRIPYALPPRAATSLTRARFGWPPERYVFLFMFDFSSYLERKNPLGLLRAFGAAFGPEDDVQLVLKCVHPEIAPADWQAVRAAAQAPNVTIMSEVLARDEVDALVQLADCYVSLHRSEGFGLTLAEAMSHGKPVIATGYSGNTDFMTATNSLPVRHRLIELESDHGPYRRGMVWADPDLDHAAELMRWVYANRDAACALGARARADIVAAYAPAAVGALVRERLMQIGRTDTLRP